MQEITSKENQVIKHICKLKTQKYRNEFGQYLIEGIKIIKEAINEKANIKYIIVNENIIENKVFKECFEEKLKLINFIKVPNNIFKQISTVDTPQGVIAVIEKQKSNLNINYAQDIILCLDNIQDPGNLGTIIRTADSCGLKQILISKETADPYNPKVIRSTMGAIFRVNIIESDNLQKNLNEARENNYKIITTSLDGKQTIYDTKFAKSVIVIGNEANGVSNEILDISDEKVIIPMLGKTESLNASVATGIVLYEYIRQKFFYK